MLLGRLAQAIDARRSAVERGLVEGLTGTPNELLIPMGRFAQCGMFVVNWLCLLQIVT
jgi:hypothetical protein